MTEELWTQFRQHLMNEGLSKNRIKKLKYVYHTIKRHIGDYTDADKDTIARFIADLNDDKITSHKRKKPYSGSTKADFKKFLRQFYKWYGGEGEYYPKTVSWIKARIPKHEKPEKKPIMTIEEVQRLAASFNKIEYRAICLLLFDSGFRIQELMSVKKKDLTFEEFEKGKKCFWIRCNKSKTVTRKVPVNLFSEQIKEFTASAQYNSLNGDETLFSHKEATIRDNLGRKSKQVFGIRMTPHCFRHSSATYYAGLLNGNLFAICQRYGWSFNSDEAKDYVRESGQYQIEGAKRAYEDEVGKLREELRAQNERMNKLQEALALLEELKQKESPLIYHI